MRRAEFFGNLTAACSVAIFVCLYYSYKFSGEKLREREMGPGAGGVLSFQLKEVLSLIEVFIKVIVVRAQYLFCVA